MTETKPVKKKRRLRIKASILRNSKKTYYGGTKRKSVGVNNAIDTRNSFMYFNLSIFLLIF